MASFDPSVIASIPDFAGNPLEARGKAYKLADMMTQEQSNKLTLASQKQQQQDEQKKRDILKNFKGDIGTPEGQIALAQQYGKEGMSSSAKEALMLGGEQQAQKLQADKQRIEILKYVADEMGPQAMAVRQTLHTQGLPAAQAAYTQALNNIPQQYRANLPPQLPNDPQQADQLLQRAEANSQQARQMLSQQLAEKRDVRADKAQELAQNRDARQAAKESRDEAKEAQRVKDQKEGVISDDAAQLAVDRILNGEQARDVLANFGRGKQGAANITKVQNALAESAKARGISPQEISSRMVEFKGLVKEQQVEAGIAGRISYAEKEIQQIGPKVIDAANKIGRGNFVPWNKLRNLAATNISDPNLKQLKVYLNTLTNSYDVLGGRGGTDVEKRAHNRALLDAADSPEALKAAVEAITQEAALSQTAAGESMRVDRGALAGGQSQGSKVLKYNPATGGFN